MRIPNNHSNRSSSVRGLPGFGTGRRLFTLILGLVLVLLLMKEAGNPEVYKRLFHRLGVPVVSEDGQEFTTVPQSLPISKAPGNVEGNDKIINEVDDTIREQLTQLLATRRNGAADPAQENDSFGELSATIGSAARSVEFDQADALELAVFRANDRNSKDDALLAELQLALDKTYLSTIEDGSVWGKNDFKAFYRNLEARKNNEDFVDPGVYVGVVPLVEQSEVYRGRRIQLSGHAVQVEALDAQQNPFGVEKYWIVWLRPIDGSERPVVVYVPSVPEPLKGLADGSELPEDGIPVIADGVFLKRYLYRSVGGYDQAPALIANLHMVVKPQVPQQKSAEAPVSLTWLVVLAALVGVAVAVVAQRSASKSDQRSRGIRQRRASPSFDELETKL